MTIFNNQLIVNLGFDYIILEKTIHNCQIIEISKHVLKRKFWKMIIIHIITKKNKFKQISVK